MHNKSINEVLLEKKEQLFETAMKCNVASLYYFQPEESHNLSYLAEAHFLVIPIPGKMSNTDLYELESKFKDILSCSVFAKTEGHLQSLLKDYTLTQAEYDLALNSQDTTPFFTQKPSITNRHTLFSTPNNQVEELVTKMFELMKPYNQADQRVAISCLAENLGFDSYIDDLDKKHLIQK